MASADGLESFVTSVRRLCGKRCHDRPRARNEVKWRGFDEWVHAVKVRKLPYAKIPVNREVKYEVPRPAVLLEKLEMLPDLFRGKSR